VKEREEEPAPPGCFFAPLLALPFLVAWRYALDWLLDLIGRHAGFGFRGEQLNLLVSAVDSGTLVVSLVLWIATIRFIDRRFGTQLWPRRY